ncbi:MULTISPECIES: NAD-dependent epimerase/dehydratase family protein [Halomonas]|uniref:Nucleoside-diphosphate-sugar epimerase n=1 Tax=Halomonas ventosae TaxID=229007 RepID=A0A4R6HID3_9GAMM|nr:NAD-dependent epimerase/dehydratase family protein [Halomonas ventosae]TDO07735.1 nucleoside-diphosphate-sugar epimerase [Halomonas ventosae]
MRTIAITGATGFIGATLCNALLMRGYRVRALTRRAPPFEAPHLTWIRGALDERAGLDALVAQADAVVHCAGSVRGASLGEFMAANVDGTLNLHEAVRRSSCARLLMLSSLAARHPALSWYARSKHEAEQRLMAAAAGPAITLFRPTAVFGPGDRELRPLLEALMRGVLPVTGTRQARLSFLHVFDLIEAILRWLDVEHAGPGPFELHDGRRQGYTWAQIAAIGASARGAPVRCLPVPAFMLRMLAWANLMLARCSGRAPMLTPGKVRELRHRDWTCNNAALTHEVGWQPHITFADALKERRLWAGSATSSRSPRT